MIPSAIVLLLPEHLLALLPEEQVDGTRNQSPVQVISVLDDTSITTFLDPEGGGGGEFGAVPVPVPAGAEAEVLELSSSTN